MTSQRPGGIVLIAILAWIAAVLQIVAGALVLSGDVDTAGVSPEAAWVAFIVGTITFLVAFALFGGSNVARVLVTVSFALSLFSAIVSIVARPSDLVSPIISGFLALIGLILLYTAKSNAYFRG